MQRKEILGPVLGCKPLDLRPLLTPAFSNKPRMGGGQGGGDANAIFFAFPLHLKEALFFFWHLLHFFLHPSCLPFPCSCGNPWTNLCHVHLFDRGGGDANAFSCIFLHRIFCCLSLHPPPPPPQMHTPARSSQCWSRQTPAWTRSVHLDAPGQRHGQQPVSGTADPRSSPTGQVIRGLR